MSKRIKLIYAIGATLTIIGSFLPWWVYGDFFPIWVYGIKTSSVLQDRGGVLIVFLCLVILLLVFLPPQFIKQPNIWNFVSVVLILVVGYNVIRFMKLLMQYPGNIGVPTLGSGMVMIISGSIILVIISLFRLSTINR